VPLVMDSEISGLENLHGYLKSGNLVVRMSFPFIELPKKHPKHIQRPGEIRPEESPKVATTGTKDGGMSEQRPVHHEIVQDRKQELTRSSSKQGPFFR